MRKPQLSFETIFAALAVLSTTAGTTACSKADRASVEPPAAAPAASAATTSTAPALQAAPPPQATAAPTTAAFDEKATAVVDAGTERRAAPSPAKSGKGASASCGATGCSAEMRKGGK